MSVLRRVGLALFAPVLAVVVAVVISSAVMAALQVDPFRVFAVMVDFGDTPSQQVTAIVVVLNRAVPLFLAGLAVAIAFRMGLFNIGVEGQYRLATVLAAGVGAAVALPGPLHVLLIVVVAMAVAAIWAGIVAVLKVTRGVSEVISSIMLNVIALGIASFLLTGPLRGSPEGASIISTAEIPESGWVPSLNGVFGVLGLADPPRQLYGFLVVALVVGAVIAVLLNRTRFGFDLRAAGLSPSAASASGVDSRAMVVKTMLLSGAVAGLIGMPDLLGSTHAYTTDFTSGLGFLGIAVALLGRNKPIGIALGALLFAFLDRALVPLQIQDFPASVVTIIQGTIVLAVVVANEVARRVARRSAERGSGPAAAVAGDGSTGPGQAAGGAGEGTGAGVSRTTGAGQRTDERQETGA
ncbi:nucleoside ABC transporter membrane protein [Geodermatophilus dictyosporus]|uniref:Nucleoside ABC transporter membrane protein n=1 Tax=Geodermatophilus dictyosporus TaxID=1523247 RepID=A0A1I5LF20_9ACTN|nr:ABC transporter permease [Geodermatophilus dictyosporus]SFO95446.1 nucleoside ABC transporter membrane protein [Geodermatophilus dictyosporus]